MKPEIKVPDQIQPSTSTTNITDYMQTQYDKCIQYSQTLPGANKSLSR